MLYFHIYKYFFRNEKHPMFLYDLISHLHILHLKEHPCFIVVFFIVESLAQFLFVNAN